MKSQEIAVGALVWVDMPASTRLFILDERQRRVHGRITDESRAGKWRIEAAMPYRGYAVGLSLGWFRSGEISLYETPLDEALARIAALESAVARLESAA